MKYNYFWDAFISDAIDRNELQYGGLTTGVIEPKGNLKIENIHKEAVEIWLISRYEVLSYQLNFNVSTRNNGPIF